MNITLKDPSEGQYAKFHTQGQVLIGIGFSIAALGGIGARDPISKTTSVVTGVALSIIGHDYCKIGSNLKTFYLEKKAAQPFTDRLDPQETIEAAIKGTILQDIIRKSITLGSVSLRPKSCLKKN